MAVESSIAVTEGAGKLLDTVQVTTSAGTVEREGVFIGDPTTGGNRANVNTAGELSVADGDSRNFLWRILQMLMAPLGYDKSLQRQRGTVIVETLPTLAAVTTVTTVTTVTGLTNINGRNGDMLINSSVNTAWALNVRARIT